MPPKITVVGLGPADAAMVTDQVKSLLTGDAPVFLRTARHPAASLVPDAPTFDGVYDAAERIEDVYKGIVDELVAFAAKHEHIVYAVPGSPSVAESTVELLRNDQRVQTDVLPAVSFLDLVWAKLGIDPLAATPRIVDGQRFATDAAGETGPMVVSQCDSRVVLSDIKLAYEDDDPGEVVVMQRLGLPDELIETIPWNDLDRVVEPDHLTTLWIEHAAVPVAHELQRVHKVARELREACPWDREQTHESLSRYAIEETYELIEAIELRSKDEALDDEHLIEELGDVLFQVFAHCAIAEEEGRFNISDVARAVTDKLIERHPHVYGEVVAETPEDVMATWESNKMAKKGRSSVMDGIPSNLPALMYATKALKKAATTDVPFSAENVEGAGLGGALLVLVDEARQRKEDPEAALRRVVDAFIAKFRAAESQRLQHAGEPNG